MTLTSLQKQELSSLSKSHLINSRPLHSRGLFYVMKYLTHPLTVINLCLVGSLGLIQAIHTRAHQKMEMDVHAYCKNNMEYQQSLDSEDDW